MNLPPTPEQAEWLKRQRAQLRETQKASGTKSTDHAKRCATCIHMRAHPFTKRFVYCSITHSERTASKMAKTKKNNVCEQWKGRE